MLWVLRESLFGMVVLSGPVAHTNGAAPRADDAALRRATSARARPARARARGSLREYLRRDVARGPRYLDHGVLLAGVGGGTPHLYRLQLALGLLDHLTIGATAHWLASQEVPGWSPTGAVAFYRSRRLEVGATYHQTLHPPPTLDEDPKTPGFEGSTHWFLTAVTVSQTWLSAGFDLGMARARELDDLAGDDSAYRVHNRLAGGVHLRAGTRRFGLTLQALAPYFEVEALLDVRFGLFEERPRGGWLSF